MVRSFKNIWHSFICYFKVFRWVKSILCFLLWGDRDGDDWFMWFGRRDRSPAVDLIQKLLNVGRVDYVYLEKQKNEGRLEKMIECHSSLLRSEALKWVLTFVKQDFAYLVYVLGLFL